MRRIEEFSKAKWAHKPQRKRTSHIKGVDVQTDGKQKFARGSTKKTGHNWVTARMKKFPKSLALIAQALNFLVKIVFVGRWATEKSKLSGPQRKAS